MFRAALLAGVFFSTSAHAVLIAPWQLEESYFFQWGDWEEVFQFGPCSDVIPYRMNNPPPFIEPVPIIYNPQPYDMPPHWIGNPPPFDMPCPPVVGTPETSTWAMMLLGLASMGWMKWRKMATRA